MADGGMLDQLKQQNYPQMVYGTSKDGNPLAIPHDQATAAAADGVTIHEPLMYMHDKSGSVTLVPHSQAAAALKDGMNTGLPMAPEPKPGVIGKTWNWLNQPVGQHFDTYNQEAQKLHDIANGPPTQAEIGHPIKAAIRHGLAGMEADVADQLNPLFAATTGAGAVAKLPGTAGALARTAGTAAGAAFAGQGVASAGMAAAGKGPYQDATPWERTAGVLSGTGNAILGGVGAAAGAHEVPSDAIQLANKGGELAQAGARIAAKPIRAGYKYVNPAVAMSAEELATRAVKPRNSKSNWQGEIASALPDMARAGKDSGLDIESMTLRDALNTVPQAKKAVWGEYQDSFLGPNANHAVSTQQAADAMRAQVTDMMREQNPGLAEKIEQVASTLDKRTLTVQELQDRVSQLNNQTRAIEARYVTDKRAAKQAPKNAYIFAQRDALRTLLDSAIEGQSGPGGAELRRRWGALNSVEDVLSRRLPVAERQNPVSLTHLLGDLSGYSSIAAGVLHGNVPLVAGGIAAKVAARQAEKLNNPNWLIQQAFAKTTARPSPSTPAEYMPEPGATSPIMPRFGQRKLRAATREYGVPERPTVDPVNNREYGDSVTPVGTAGKAGVMIRPAGLLPEHQEGFTQRQLPPISLPETNDVPSNLEAVGMPQTAEASALQNAARQGRGRTGQRMPVTDTHIQEAAAKITAMPIEQQHAAAVQLTQEVAEAIANGGSTVNGQVILPGNPKKAEAAAVKIIEQEIAEVEQPAVAPGIPQALAERIATREARPVASRQPAEGDFGQAHEGFYHDAQGAIDRLLADKDGEAIAALHHPEVGDIDLVYGKEGNLAKDFDGGYGLAKIAQKHPEVLNDLQGFIDSLSVKSRSDNRIVLGDKDGKAVVSLNWLEKPKRWLLSAYRNEGELSAANGRTIGDTNRAEPTFPAGQEADSSSLAATGGRIGVTSLTEPAPPASQVADEPIIPPSVKPDMPPEPEDVTDTGQAAVAPETKPPAEMERLHKERDLTNMQFESLKERMAGSGKRAPSTATQQEFRRVRGVVEHLDRQIEDAEQRARAISKREGTPLTVPQEKIISDPDKNKWGFQKEYFVKALEPAKQAWIDRYDGFTWDDIAKEPPRNRGKINFADVAQKAENRPADFPDEFIRIEVPGDGKFLVRNNPVAIDKLLRSAPQAFAEPKPHALPKLPNQGRQAAREFDPARYIAQIEKNIAELEDRLAKDKRGNYGQGALQIMEELKAEHENLAEAKKISDAPANPRIGTRAVATRVTRTGKRT